MVERFFRRAAVRDRMRANPIGSWLVRLVSDLAKRGYSTGVVQLYAQAVEHFGRWLGAKGVVLTDIDQATVDKFLSRHLRSCRCRSPAPRDFKAVRAALRHLAKAAEMTALFTPRAARVSGDIQSILTSFDVHMEQTCGLSEITRGYRLRYAREFLVHSFGGSRLRLKQLSAPDVVGFVTRYARRCSPGTGQVAASALRGFLRFLRLQGLIDIDLAEAAPRVAKWRLSSLPLTLSEKELQELLAVPDVSEPIGQRDLAAMLCMADMGLRADEVAELHVGDIDWRRSTMLVSAGKRRRGHVVPMPVRVAKAIATYLRKGRPQTDERALFVRHQGPCGARLLPRGVSGIVRRASARAWRQPSRSFGTHILRHTAASRMLQRGASLKAIADVLGHRSLDTTAIYAKVDLQALRAVALPWPSGEAKA